MSEVLFGGSWAGFMLIGVWTCWKLGRRTGLFSPPFIFALVFTLQIATYPVAWRVLESNDFASLLGSTSEKLARDAVILALSALSMVVFLAGLQGKRAISAKVEPRASLAGFQTRLIVGMTVVVFAIAYVQLFQFLGAVGSGAFTFSELRLYRSGGLAGTGEYTYPALHGVPMCYALALCSVLGRPLTWRAKIWLPIGGVLMILPPLLLGFRIYVVISLLMILAAVHYFHNRVTLKSLLAVGLTVLTTFAAYGYVRDLVERDVVGLDNELNYAEQVLSPVTRTRATDIIDFVLRSDAQHEWFSLVLPETLSSAIPREFRPDIQIATVRFGASVMGDYFYLRSGDLTNVAGISPTIMGFALWQAGFIGLFLVLFFAGRLSRWLSTMLQASPSAPFRRTYLILVFASLVHAIEAPQDSFNGFFVRTLILTALYLVVRTLTYFHRGVRVAGPVSRTNAARKAPR